MRKKLHYLLRLAPVAVLLCAGIASAQVTGQIVGQVTDAASGKPVAGALVIATSPALQGESTAVTDAKGEYTLTTLPPGKYKVAAQLSGYKPTERTDIVLRVGYTLRANLSIIPEAVQMEEQVVKTGLAPVVNIGTAEAGTIVSKEFLSSIPTARTYENVATIAPTAQRDFYGISFAGASSPENNYIIDGLRVSDPALGTLGTNLLTNFVDQLDIKVGSFMPEFGYSSAGIINTVTKSGGNEFHGSIWGNLTPGFFTPALPAIGTNGDGLASYSSPYKGSYAADFGVEVGGPIVKDKLWFYAGFAPQMSVQRADHVLPLQEPGLRPRPVQPALQERRDDPGRDAARRLPAGRHRPVHHGPHRGERPGLRFRLQHLLRHRQAHLAHQREQQRLRVLQHAAHHRLRPRDGLRLAGGCLDQGHQQHHERHVELHRQVPRQAPPRRGQGRLVQLHVHRGRRDHQRRRPAQHADDQLAHRPADGELRAPRLPVPHQRHRLRPQQLHHRRHGLRPEPRQQPVRG